MDRDGSGKVDCDEIVAMLLSLGVNPSPAEVEEMLDSADLGEKDGKIDMREWLMWYAKGMQGARDVMKEDATDAFSKLAGNKPLSKVQLRAYLREEYDLEFSPEELNSIFDTSPHADTELSFDDFCHLLVPQKTV